MWFKFDLWVDLTLNCVAPFSQILKTSLFQLMLGTPFVGSINYRQQYQSRMRSHILDIIYMEHFVVTYDSSGEKNEHFPC